MADQNVSDGGTAVAEQTAKPKREFKRYGISDKEFAAVWNAASSVAEVAKQLSNDQRGEVPASFVNSRANQMRQRGWVPPALKFMGGAGRPAVARDVVTEQAEIVAAQRNIKQGTPEFEALVTEIKEKIEKSNKERAEAAERRKAAKAAKAETEKETAPAAA